MPTVLIIDEREAVRTALEILLSLNGHDAICTSGPEDGLRAMAAEAVDLVVLQAERSDEDVACETSIALVRSVRMSRPSLPFVVLAGPNGRASAELLSADAVELVTTAWNDQQLLHTVKFLLDRRNSTAHGREEPSDADIEQALLRARGTLSKAARQLGMSKEALIRRMHRLRMMN